MFKALGSVPGMDGKKKIGSRLGGKIARWVKVLAPTADSLLASPRLHTQCGWLQVVL